MLAERYELNKICSNAEGRSNYGCYYSEQAQIASGSLRRDGFERIPADTGGGGVSDERSAADQRDSGCRIYSGDG